MYYSTLIKLKSQVKDVLVFINPNPVIILTVLAPSLQTALPGSASLESRLTKQFQPA